MNKITQEQIDNFKFLIEEKKFTQKLAALATGIPVKSATYYINTRNIEVKVKSKRFLSNDDYFDIIDTENKAYILGFILADGSVIIEKDGSKRICFSNSIDDLEIIEKIRNEISPDSKIIRRNDQRGAKFRKEQVNLRINSIKLVDTLINEYKIKPRKTYDSLFEFDFNKIPHSLIRHFIRGYFDGDGSVSFYLIKRKNSKLEYVDSFFFNFSFIMNSLLFTEQIAHIFEKEFNIIPVIYKNKSKNCIYWSLRFNYSQNRANKIFDIYNYLYQESSIFLSRKKIKFENYLEYRAKLKK